MDQKFTSNEEPLADLLRKAAAGLLQLPDFQRGWVWDDAHIVSLLASISHSYPIGAVMTLRTGNPEVKFQPRPIEGVKLEQPQEPEFMLLDGQQRMTSLYLALHSSDPVPTRDSRGRDALRHYYANIDACIDPFSDREDDGIVSVPEDRRITSDFGRQVDLDLSTRESEIEAGHFPLDIVLDGNETMDWQMAFLSDGPGDHDERLDKWKRFVEAVVKPFTSYQVPAIELAKSTPKEAVCQVFEKVNTGGVSLTVFELLTATFAAENFNLREDWNSRRSEFDGFPVLERFEATDFLQIVTLLATLEARRAHVAGGHESERAPAVSCKRKDVLRLTLAAYEKWADVRDECSAAGGPFLALRRHLCGEGSAIHDTAGASLVDSCRAWPQSRGHWPHSTASPVVLVRCVRRDVRRCHRNPLRQRSAGSRGLGATRRPRRLARSQPPSSRRSGC